MRNSAGEDAYRLHLLGLAELLLALPHRPFGPLAFADVDRETDDAHALALLVEDWRIRHECREARPVFATHVELTGPALTSRQRIDDGRRIGFT